MEKSINDYINELREMQSRSRFNEARIAVNTSPAEMPVPPANNATGILKLSVTHSQNTFPVAGAQFSVTDKNGNVVNEGTTDMSGKSPNLTLPAIPKSLSEQPGTNLINSAVFYDVTIDAENYIPFTIKNIPVFEGVTTLQNFDMTFFGASPDGQPRIITLPTENSL